MHTQGQQGCQKKRNFVRNTKILIARSMTIKPKLNKIKNHLPFFDEFWWISHCFFDFAQFWLDGRPGNEYFWISHKIFGLLTPLTPLGVHPQLLKTTVWNRYERFLLLWIYSWYNDSSDSTDFKESFAGCRSTSEKCVIPEHRDGSMHQDS